MEALITPAVIKWAREQSGFNLEQVSNKLKRPLEQLESWEKGLDRPTISQARRLSEIYKRPLAVFYMSEPPLQFETLRDYRRLPEDQAREFTTELLELIRQIVEHHEWTRDFFLDEEIDPLSFIGTFNIDDSPKKVAESILDTLNISKDDLFNVRTRGDALRYWIRRAEDAGVFVSRQGSVDLKECRGFVISDEIAPFIYINSSDAEAGQLFTLVHELAHLWLGTSGISNDDIKGVYESGEIRKIEIFCNEVASLALLNEELFREKWSRFDEMTDVETRLSQLSILFKVSEEVIARRLLNERKISSAKYTELRDIFRTRWEEQEAQRKQKMKERPGGPSYYVTKIMNNGLSYTRTVLSAYGDSTITSRDASALLNVKLNNLPKLATKTGINLPSYLGS